jgi:hypothetical protein
LHAFARESIQQERVSAEILALKGQAGACDERKRLIQPDNERDVETNPPDRAYVAERISRYSRGPIGWTRDVSRCFHKIPFLSLKPQSIVFYAANEMFVPRNDQAAARSRRIGQSNSPKGLNPFSFLWVIVVMGRIRLIFSYQSAFTATGFLRWR